MFTKLVIMCLLDGYEVAICDGLLQAALYTFQTVRRRYMQVGEA